MAGIVWATGRSAGSRMKKPFSVGTRAGRARRGAFVRRAAWHRLEGRRAWKIADAIIETEVFAQAADEVFIGHAPEAARNW